MHVHVRSYVLTFVLSMYVCLDACRCVSFIDVSVYLAILFKLFHVAYNAFYIYIYTYRIERKSGKKGRSFLSSNSLTFKLFKLLTLAYLIYFWGVSLS